MSDVLDFHLDDLGPANSDSAYAEQQFWAGDLTVLAEHHTTPHGSHSYVVAHDGSVTWGVPGEPQMAAIKVARDLSLNTFTFELKYHATVAFAQKGTATSWSRAPIAYPRRSASTWRVFQSSSGLAPRPRSKL
ncbi:hypothetical protein [Streptomyces sp. LN549]|uniref:hypothetical protein n=1 Tax=Streptomyces sp. LN549 TaxID=3112979 RepID=UPI0037177A62